MYKRQAERRPDGEDEEQFQTQELRWDQPMSGTPGQMPQNPAYIGSVNPTDENFVRAEMCIRDSRICDYHGLRASGLAGWGTEGCQQVFNRHGDGGHRREYRPGEAGDDRGKANFYGNLLLGSNYRSEFIRNLMME